MSRPGIEPGPPAWEASTLEKSLLDSLSAGYSEPLLGLRRNIRPLLPSPAQLSLEAAGLVLSPICKPFKEPRNRFPAWRNRFLRIDSWLFKCLHIRTLIGHDSIQDQYFSRPLYLRLTYTVCISRIFFSRQICRFSSRTV